MISTTISKPSTSTAVDSGSFGASKLANDSGSNSGINVGTVVGATAGGLAVLSALGGGFYIALRRPVCSKRVSPSTEG